MECERACSGARLACESLPSAPAERDHKLYDYSHVQSGLELASGASGKGETTSFAFIEEWDVLQGRQLRRRLCAGALTAGKSWNSEWRTENYAT